jgi:arginyl-tRNA synthetase
MLILLSFFASLFTNPVSLGQGESFYNPYISSVLEELDRKGLLRESEGAKVIHLDGQNIPLIVVKKDGGFNYASTDLAALWYEGRE